ncbi:hypothetical protein CF327_g3418 [Tilletia walkeri]|uniref:Carboxylic ester hydrolase n=1 Tax=Tilletia walkeri TaxID=117179 RepID=A0A8X7N3M8_9BASI|nr:hypothetical protein CF327_g3418 [Tilletia walkeri]KAE8265879.1 hypothetical protein A4X09_0g6467 [Tilletia walkeri]
MLPRLCFLLQVCALASCVLGTPTPHVPLPCGSSGPPGRCNPHPGPKGPPIHPPGLPKRLLEWLVRRPVLRDDLPPASNISSPSVNFTDPRIDIKQGSVIGYTECVDDVAISSFLGIPYAQPTTGQKRFTKPEPVPEGNDVIEAKAYGHICWQVVAKNYPQEMMDEDCLTINVMAPADAHLRKKKLPVMVWHHGGGFTTGASTYHNGSRLVAESVKLGAPAIWVNFNYRINAFGFLSSSQMLAAAQRGEAGLNLGLYDARLALRWVQENICKFGGDPQRVMIFGQSAGAYAVASQLLANGGDKEGLFQSAIMHSGSPGAGSALSPTHPRIEATFKNLTQMVNCPDDETSLQCLRETDQALLGNVSAIIAQNFNDYPLLGYWPWQPVQDAAVDGYWFSEQPTNLVKEGQYAVVPMITGDCADEGTFFAAHDLQNASAFDEWFRRIALADVSTDPEQQSRVDGLLERLYELVPDDVTQGSPYFNAPTNVSKGITNVSDPFYQPETNQYKRAARMFSTWRYEAARRKFLRLFVDAHPGTPAWTYRFAQLDLQINAAIGTAHGSEIVYILGNTSTINSKGLYTPLSKLMQRAWISFANYHDPTALGQIDWPQYTESGREMIQFKGLNVTLIRDDYQEEALAFMKSDEMSSILSS